MDDNAVLVNFLVISSIQVNTLGYTIFLQVPHFLISAASYDYARCVYTEGFEDDVKNGCGNYMTNQLWRRFMISIVVIVGHYF